MLGDCVDELAVNPLKREEKNSRSSLSKRIFLYLLGIAFLSVISLGFFWIQGKRHEYSKEVILLRQTFSETKKLEIKNKIPPHRYTS
jgi:hypothetical protein